MCICSFAPKKCVYALLCICSLKKLIYTLSVVFPEMHRYSVWRSDLAKIESVVQNQTQGITLMPTLRFTGYLLYALDAQTGYPLWTRDTPPGGIIRRFWNSQHSLCERCHHFIWCLPPRRRQNGFISGYSRLASPAWGCGSQWSTLTTAGRCRRRMVTSRGGLHISHLQCCRTLRVIINLICKVFGRWSWNDRIHSLFHRVTKYVYREVWQQCRPAGRPAGNNGLESEVGLLESNVLINSGQLCLRL